MSCAAVAVVAVLMLGGVEAAAAPPPASPMPVASVATQPLFADIVSRARSLKSIVDGWAVSGVAQAPGFTGGSAFADFRGQALDLAALNMRGHLTLAESGADNDLKCILRGIAEDMPGRLDAVAEAGGDAARAEALSELSHLLDDNAAVILAPPAGR